MRELEPSLGERVCELLRVLVEALRDLCVGRIHPQGEVCREHHRRVPLRRIVRIRHGACAGAVFRRPLMRAGRAFR